MSGQDDVVLAQLRKLREGLGMTADRLKASGAVMSALGTSDPQLALDRLLAFLHELGDGERARALRVDFGIDLAHLLGRNPHPREQEWLGERRSAYATVLKRDSKTLGRWSDKALAELRAKLLADQFDGHLFVVAAVDDGRILGTTTIQRSHDLDDGGPETHQSTNYDNPSTEPSLPALIYGIPRDWRPQTLTLAVVFRNQPYPKQLWAVVARDFFQVSYGTERYALPLAVDTVICRVDRPRVDRLYAIVWLPNGVFDTG